MDDPITARDVRNALRDHQFRHANENEMEAGIEQILTDGNGLALTVRRQVRLSDRDRIDLTVELPRPAGAVLLGIEVKVAGRAGAVREQLLRYTEHNQLGALLLFTTIHNHMMEIMPLVREAPAGNQAGARWLLAGKPFEIVLLRRGLL